MCGIIACISDNNCSTILYHGLVQLKNRGYDSVGICSISQEKTESAFLLNKYASLKNIDIYEKLHNELYNHEKSKCGIAHTRWATHGSKTDDNSHPHMSMCGKFSLVHNGIIENYKQIKNMLLNENYIFKSQTDTEVIVQLLSFLYKTNKNINECIQKMNTMLEGTWGLAILCLDEPDTIYCVRHGSPLLIGYDDNMAIIVSEKSAFCNNINKYFVLNNLDICKITKTTEGIKINTTIEYLINSYENIKYDLTPKPYPHWTLKEIYEQPEICLKVINMGGRLLDNNKVKLGGLDKYVEQLTKIDNLILMGCGTSYFAGQYGVHFFKDLCDFNTVQLFDGAEFTEKDIPKYGKTAFILLSQSGETKDLHRCIDIGRQNNILLIGVVNVVDSLIAREVDCGCYLNAGREVAVASTKAYTAQVILLSMIAIWFSQIHNFNEYKRIKMIKDLHNLGNDFKNTIQGIEEEIKMIASNLLKYNNLFLLGKGTDEFIAKEGSLKIKEISYIHSEGYSASSLKHGPFALLDENFPTIIINCHDEHTAKVLNCFEEVHSRNSPIIIITNNNLDLKKECSIIKISKNNSYGSLLAIIPFQLLAYYLSINKGINPDIPKNLAKVVTVE